MNFKYVDSNGYIIGDYSIDTNAHSGYDVRHQIEKGQWIHVRTFKKLRQAIRWIYRDSGRYEILLYLRDKIGDDYKLYEGLIDKLYQCMKPDWVDLETFAQLIREAEIPDDHLKRIYTAFNDYLDGRLLA